MFDVFVCYMMVLNNIVETDSYLSIPLFIRLTDFKKKMVSAKIYYNMHLYYDIMIKRWFFIKSVLCTLTVNNII